MRYSKAMIHSNWTRHKKLHSKADYILYYIIECNRIVVMYIVHLYSYKKWDVIENLQSDSLSFTILSSRSLFGLFLMLLRPKGISFRAYVSHFSTTKQCWLIFSCNCLQMVNSNIIITFWKTISYTVLIYGKHKNFLSKIFWT
jgi:hypothetical protein